MADIKVPGVEAPERAKLQNGAHRPGELPTEAESGTHTLDADDCPPFAPDPAPEDVPFSPMRPDHLRLVQPDESPGAARLDDRPWSDREGCRYLAPLSKAERDALPYGHWAKSLRWTEKLDKETEAILCKPASAGMNISLILRHDRRWAGVLAFDDMAKRVTTVAMPPWHETEPTAGIGVWDPDTDPQRLSEWLQAAYGFYNQGADAVARNVLLVAHDRVIHPVREWIKSLPPHDGIPRVDTLFSRYVGAPDTTYTRAISRVFLLGLVARAMQPGCKHDLCVVLEGEQGLRKSTFCERLVGSEWYAASTTDVSSKDARLAMHGKWLIEMPELAGMAKSQVEPTKAFFSSASDWLRPPYARGLVNLKRSSATIASTNDRTYLRDRTGNRRYPPIPVGVIDANGVERDREQIFAEAFALYQGGAEHWITDPDILAQLSSETKKREVVDPREDQVLAWLGERIATGVRGEVGVTTVQALEFLGVPRERQTPEAGHVVASIFRRAGLEVSRPRDRAAEAEAAARGERYTRPRVWRWVNPDAEADEDSS